MFQVQLNGTPIRTSAIGLGCGSLTGAASKNESLHLLNTAFDANITHFDVATSYGYGVSELILGEFARNKRDKISITSKYGIQVNKSMAHNQGLMNFAHKVAKALPFVKKILRRSASRLVTTALFTPSDAQASLEQSLRKLQTDYLDIFLLHEASLQTSATPDLISWIESQIQSGKIRAAGVGSEFPQLGNDAAAFNPLYSVLQFQSNLETPNLHLLQNAHTRGIITHGSLRVLPALFLHLQHNLPLRNSLQQLLNADPIEALPSALLRLAAVENPQGIILFASKNPRHVSQILAAIQNSTYSPQLLHSLAQLLTPVLRSGNLVPAGGPG